MAGHVGRQRCKVKINAAEPNPTPSAAGLIDGKAWPGERQAPHRGRRVRQFHLREVHGLGIDLDEAAQGSVQTLRGDSAQPRRYESGKKFERAFRDHDLNGVGG
jgi:hypothetical protein